MFFKTRVRQHSSLPPTPADQNYEEVINQLLEDLVMVYAEAVFRIVSFNQLQRHFVEKRYPTLFNRGSLPLHVELPTDKKVSH